MNLKKKRGQNGVTYAKLQPLSLKVILGVLVSVLNSATLAYYLLN